LLRAASQSAFDAWMVAGRFVAGVRQPNSSDITDRHMPASCAVGKHIEAVAGLRHASTEAFERLSR
jgi:hypothetical protein